MTPEQTAHCESIAKTFQLLMAAKYKAGVEEHGGNLWEKTGLIDMAIDEAIDQVVYLVTLKQQIEAGTLGVTDEAN